MRDREMLRLMTVLCIPLHLQYRCCPLLRLVCVCVLVCGGVFLCVCFLVVGYPFPQAHSFPVQPCAKEIAMLGGLVRVGRETGAREACMCTLAC